MANDINPNELDNILYTAENVEAQQKFARKVLSEYKEEAGNLKHFLLHYILPKLDKKSAQYIELTMATKDLENTIRVVDRFTSGEYEIPINTETHDTY